MLKHLILKEIREIITNARSLFVLLICCILIPLGLYISTKEYEQNLAAYKDARQMYEEQYKDKNDINLIIQGYIPPSPLSIFSSGLSNYLPDKITTNSKGYWQSEKDFGINNPIALLFGKIDFLFIVTYILSLLAFMFTFNSITGEKESGTLRLVASNSVSRWEIILAKIIGNYLVFLLSFITGVLLGLILILLITSVSILTPQYLVPLLVIFIISLLFLFILFNVGIWLSIRTKNSGASITASLLLWVLITIIIPKVSPMIAQVIKPIETEEVVNKQKTLKRDEIRAEFGKASGDLLASIMKESGLNAETFSLWSEWNNPLFANARASYDKKANEIRKKYDDLTNEAIEKIEKDYNTKKQVQQSISKNISRISPVSCFTYLITDFTNTGLGEFRNIESNANRFKYLAESEYYAPMRKYYKEYWVGGSYTCGLFDFTNKEKVKIPALDRYIYPSMMVLIVNNWVDILLICFYTLLFFAFSIFQFFKYDVR